MYMYFDIRKTLYMSAIVESHRVTISWNNAQTNFNDAYYFNTHTLTPSEKEDYMLAVPSSDNLPIDRIYSPFYDSPQPAEALTLDQYIESGKILEIILPYNRKCYGFTGSIFSNFHAAPFTVVVSINSIQHLCTFATSEHYYQCIKAIKHHEFERAKRIIRSAMPKTAKSIANEFNINPCIWTNEIKERTMLHALRAKANANPVFRQLLLATGDAHLAEITPRNSDDCYWAIGQHKGNIDPNTLEFTGHNVLGKLLMKVRTEVKHLYNFN